MNQYLASLEVCLLFFQFNYSNAKNMDNIPEYLDFLSINSKNAKRFLRVIANICMTFCIYDYLGGSVTFPKEITSNHVFEFIKTYQILIPIILYSFTWILFHTILKSLMRLIVHLFLDKEKHYTETPNNNDERTKIQAIISKLAKFEGGDEINWSQISSKKLEEDYRIVLSKANAQIEDSLDRILIFVQIWIVSKGQVSLVFGNQVLIAFNTIFIIGTLLIIRKIILIKKAEKVTFVLKEKLSEQMD